MTRGVWTVDTIARVIVAALVPPLVIVLYTQGVPGAQRLAISLGVVVFWQLAFKFARGQALSPAGAVTVVSIAVLAPGELAFWQLMLALSFGFVIGELIFGGWGRNVFSSAVATLAFLFFSFPHIQHPPVDDWLILACIPAAVLLLLTRILSWRIVVGFAMALLVTMLVYGADVSALVVQGGLAFGLIFLVGDPVAAATTNPGRWLYGALCGVLTGLFGLGGAGIGAPQAVVFAALLGSIFAPLMDHGVIMAMSYARRRHD